MTQPQAITAAILAEIDAYLSAGLAVDAQRINNGLCADFAADVATRLGSAAYVEEYEVANFLLSGSISDDGMPIDRRLLQEAFPDVSPPLDLTWDDLDTISAHHGWRFGLHVWLSDGTLHYDAEHPEGVLNFFDLAFFQREIAHWREAQTVLPTQDRREDA